MKDFFAGMKIQTDIEAKDVVGKLLVIKTDERLEHQMMQQIGAYLKERGSLGAIAMPRNAQLQTLDDDELERIGLRRIDFMGELEGL